jgi:hypothetical protein
LYDIHSQDRSTLAEHPDELSDVVTGTGAWV